jgi:hypothetical protein
MRGRHEEDAGDLRTDWRDPRAVGAGGGSDASDFKNSAKYCKAVRATKGVEAFGALYGTNANKKNAFGKCVSKTAKNTAGAREDADDAAEAKAAADCKKQQADDAAKFAEKYKNLGQCVKAQTNDDDD